MLYIYMEIHMSQPLMPKATAIWLVENTALTFEQIADFCGLHILEVEAIANNYGSMRGFDPIASSQLTHEEIKRCEEDPNAKLKIRKAVDIDQLISTNKSKYTPLARRKDKPSAILWLTKYYPELGDSQICKFLGTTKATVQSIRDKSYWNYLNLEPKSPVSLGFCTKTELEDLVKVHA